MTAGAHGDLPEGLTFEKRNRGTLIAHVDGEYVGSLMWMEGTPNPPMYPTSHPWVKGEVINLEVKPEWQRRGIANALWERAQQEPIPPIHSTNQTPDGKAWSATVTAGAGGMLDSLNPTGGLFVEYEDNCRFRATAPLAANMTTLAETMGVSPDAMVTVYRGMPKGYPARINPGDFIVTDRQPASDYAGEPYGVVVEKRVRYGDVLDDRDEPGKGEFGMEYLYRPGADKQVKTAGTASLTLHYLHNTEQSPDMGSRFGQDIEPHGRYLISDDTGLAPSTGWQSGIITFDNPLRIPFGGGYGDATNWKHVLVKRYGGKTGEALSLAIVADGYDAIITQDSYGMSEIVDLTRLRRTASSDITYEVKVSAKGDKAWVAAYDGPVEFDNRIGILEWLIGGSTFYETPGQHTINNVYVKPAYQRRGIATEMLRRARERDPLVVHNQQLTSDGDGWATKVGGEDYWMGHRPGDDLATLDDLTPTFGEDVYSHPEWYQTMTEPYSHEAVRIVRAVRGKPDVLVDIYRALPAEHVSAGIRTGDWVAIARGYARQHGMQSDPKDDWPIITARVPAKTLHNGGSDLNEWGYWGPPISAKTSVKVGSGSSSPLLGDISRLSDHAKAEIDRQLPMLPAHDVAVLVAWGVKIVGTTKAGQPKGIDYGAVYSRSDRQIQLSERRADALQGAYPHSCVLLHELGHAMDHAKGRLSQWPAFLALQREAKPWKGVGGNYFRGRGRGAEEMMAEAYAATHGHYAPEGFTLTDSLKEIALGIHGVPVTGARTASPSWRDYGEMPTGVDCIIAPDTGRSRRNNFQVFVYGSEMFGRYPRLSDAKAAVEEIYGPVVWKKVPGDQKPHFDPVWGNVTWLNDAKYFVVCEHLPRLGKMAAIPENLVLRVEFPRRTNEGHIIASVDGVDVGALRWDYLSEPPSVIDMSVDENWQRQGIATAMWQEALRNESKLHHSDVLTPDGRAWMQTLSAVTMADDPTWYGRQPYGNDLRPADGSQVRGVPMDPTTVPATLYHVTTALSAVRSSGYLKAGGTGGLQGDPNDKVVSLTTDKEIASNLAVSMRLMARVATAAKPLHDRVAQSLLIIKMFKEFARSEGWEWSSLGGEDPKYDHLLKDYAFTDWHKPFFMERARRTGHRNPAFFFATIEQWSAYRPSDIGILTVTRQAVVDSKAMVTDFDLGRGAYGLQEIRVYGDVKISGVITATVRSGGRRTAAQNWYHNGDKPPNAYGTVKGEGWVHLGTLDAAGARGVMYPQRNTYQVEIRPRHPVNSVSSPTDDYSANRIDQWLALGAPIDSKGQPFIPKADISGASDRERLAYAVKTIGYVHGTTDAIYYTNGVEDLGHVSVMVRPDAITKVTEMFGGQQGLFASVRPGGRRTAKVVAAALTTIHRGVTVRVVDADWDAFKAMSDPEQGRWLLDRIDTPCTSVRSGTHGRFKPGLGAHWSDDEAVAGGYASGGSLGWPEHLHLVAVVLKAERSSAVQETDPDTLLKEKVDPYDDEQEVTLRLGSSVRLTSIEWYLQYPDDEYKSMQVSVTKVAAALSLEDVISVAESVMEANHHTGRVWHLPPDGTYPKKYDNPDYWAAMAPITDFVRGACLSEGVTTSCRVVNDPYDMEPGAQASVDSMGNMMSVHTVVNDLTVLHECAHIVNNSDEGAGHDLAFAQTAHRLYARYLGAEAAQIFANLVLDRKQAKTAVTYPEVYTLSLGKHDLSEFAGLIPPADISMLKSQGVSIDVQDTNKGGAYAAWYDSGARTIVLHVQVPPGTVAHEVGHAIDHSLGWISASSAYKAVIPKGYMKHMGKPHRNISLPAELYAMQYAAAINPGWAMPVDDQFDMSVLRMLALKGRTHRNSLASKTATVRPGGRRTASFDRSRVRGLLAAKPWLDIHTSDVMAGKVPGLTVDPHISPGLAGHAYRPETVVVSTKWATDDEFGRFMLLTHEVGHSVPVNRLQAEPDFEAVFSQITIPTGSHPSFSNYDNPWGASSNLSEVVADGYSEICMFGPQGSYEDDTYPPAVALRMIAKVAKAAGMPAEKIDRGGVLRNSYGSRTATSKIPKPGTLPVPSGHTRCWTRVGAIGRGASAEVIKREGLRIDKATVYKDQFGDFQSIWATSGRPTEANVRDTEVLVEFSVPTKEIAGLGSLSDGSTVQIGRDVPPSEFLYVYESWMGSYWYLADDPLARQRVKDGFYDDILESTDPRGQAAAKAIQVIKREGARTAGLPPGWRWDTNADGEDVIRQPRANTYGPVLTQAQAKAQGWDGPYYHGTTKANARNMCSRGFREVRFESWELSLPGTQEGIDPDLHNDDYILIYASSDIAEARSFAGDGGEVVMVYLRPGTKRQDAGDATATVARVSDIAVIKDVKVASHTADTSKIGSMTWKRYWTGYLSSDGRWFIERGARMTDGGTAWLLWRKANPGEVSSDGPTAYVDKPQEGSAGGPVRRLTELRGDEVSTWKDESSPFFVHVYDAGDLAEAKYTAQWHDDNRR